MARRLSHRVVAIGSFPPSSESWRPTHSTHKFTRANRVGGEQSPAQACVLASCTLVSRRSPLGSRNRRSSWRAVVHECSGCAPWGARHRGRRTGDSVRGKFSPTLRVEFKVLQGSTLFPLLGPPGASWASFWPFWGLLASFRASWALLGLILGLLGPPGAHFGLILSTQGDWAPVGTFRVFFE